MKSHTPALIALLNSSNQFIMADLYTISPVSSAELRFTSADVDIVHMNETFSSRGPIIRRGQVRTVLGLEVDTLDLTINASTTDSAHFIDGQPFIPAALSGALDGAQVLLHRAILTDWAQPPVGAVLLFIGRVSDMSGTRTELNVRVKSDLELLNIKLPRHLYQASCLHTLYDSGCAANQEAFTVFGSVTGHNGTGQWLQSGLSTTAGWFDQGVITFITGPNAGQRRTIKAYASGQFWFALPLPHVPTVGDGFTVYPGCDKTQATCQSKFNNLIQFRGFPYIPTPETTT